MVDGVHVVVARPGRAQAQRFEARHAVRQRRPQLLFELGVVDAVKRRFVGVSIARRRAADETAPLGSKPQARRVDHQRAAGQRGRAVEHKHITFLGHHGQRDAQLCSQRCHPRTSGQQHLVGGPCAAVGSPHGPHRSPRRAAVRLNVEPHGVGVDETRAAMDGLAAKGLHERRAVEPPFARQAQRGQCHVTRMQPVEALTQIKLRQQGHVGAVLALGLVVALQGRHTGVGGQVQITRLDQADGRRLTVHRQFVGHTAQELHAPLRQLNVYRLRKLLPDRAGRQRAGRTPVSGVAFEHGDRHAVVARQKTRGGRAHHPAADDHHTALHHASLFSCPGARRRALGAVGCRDRGHRRGTTAASSPSWSRCCQTPPLTPCRPACGCWTTPAVCRWWAAAGSQPGWRALCPPAGCGQAPGAHLAGRQRRRQPDHARRAGVCVAWLRRVGVAVLLTARLGRPRAHTGRTAHAAGGIR